MQRGAISVNFLCLPQLGAGICICIKMAQLAQESHPWSCQGRINISRLYVIIRYIEVQL